MYSNGRGVPQNDIGAVKWYTKAAEEGNPDAQCLLGDSYYHGRGVLKDYVQAYMWYDLSSGDGSNEGHQNKESIAEKMTSTQIAKAQEMSRLWLERTNDKYLNGPFYTARFQLV